MFVKSFNSIRFCREGEWLTIRPWGKNGIRVQAVRSEDIPAENWALIDTEEVLSCVEYDEMVIDGRETVVSAQLTNGKISATVNKFGKLTVTNDKGEVMLKEYWRDDKVSKKQYDSSLMIWGRELKPIVDGDYSLTVRFEPNDEKIYGMGQYQQAIMDLKGCDIELAHRNSQASVPFYISSKGYGFLWNNPAIGRVVFGKNMTTWNARSTKAMDYWVTCGDTPKEIEQQYADVTGKTPKMPEYAMGFWQCKLRYRTQEEILSVAREYKKRNLPIDVIVIDYFHWPFLGDFRFDEKYWPDPDSMLKEFKDMGIEPVISIWPFVEDKSENYPEMNERGYLVRSEKGLQIALSQRGHSMPYDTTHPGARRFVWEKAKKNYYDKGIKIFWLDEAEPEYQVYDFENYRYYLGPNTQVGNIYPNCYAQGFYEGRKAEGETEILNLIRCAWAGAQKYGTLVWSGDIHSSFESFKQQICAGLSMAISGIPWWTTDIGGFSGGHVDDPEFHELLVRWFQYGTFCPVMRLHGNRLPFTPGTDLIGGGCCGTGAPNEVWSYGEDVYNLLKPYLFVREALKPYIKEVMTQAHENGDPVMRPLFYEYPQDENCWNVEDSYLFGDKILVCPVTDYKQRERKVYLPKGDVWTDVWTQQKYDGGQWVTVSAPLSQIPLFCRDGFDSNVILNAAKENGLE